MSLTPESISKPINIAVWGLGKHALNNIIPVIAKNDHFKLLGVYSRNSTTVQETCDNFDCQSWASEDDFLNDDRLDVIYLSTPIGLHAEQGRRILGAGKHFWCEKPLCTNLTDLESLWQLALQNNLSIFEGFMFFYHPQYLTMIDLLDKKTLGDISTIYCRFGLPALEASSFRYNKELCGGALYDVGCYPIAIINALVSGLSPVLIEGKLEFIENYDVDMHGHVVLSYQSGIKAFLEWKIGAAYRNEIDIWGEEGSFYSDKIFSKPEDYEPSFEIRDNFGNKKSLKIDNANHFQLMFNAFAVMMNKPLERQKEYEQICKRVSLLEKIAKLDSP